MLFLPAAMSVLLLSACATTEGYDKKVHAWPGQPAEQLIKQWGEPNLIVPLKNGNKEYQYLNDQEVAVPQQNTDPFAYNRELSARTQHNQAEPFAPKGYSWGSDSVSPSFSLFSAP